MIDNPQVVVESVTPPSSEPNDGVTPAGVNPEVHPVQELVSESAYGMLNEEERKRIGFMVRKDYREILKDALIANYVSRGKHLIQHAVELAYEDTNVLIALLKKIVPDKTGVVVSFGLSEEEIEELRQLRASGKPTQAT